MLSRISATRAQARSEARRRAPILWCMLIGLLTSATASPAAGAGQEVDRLLARAEQAVAANRLTTPAGDNAVAYIERALALNPEDSRAAALLQQVVARYERLVDKALGQGEQARLRSLDRAITFRDRADQVIAKHGLSGDAVVSMDESIALLGKPAAPPRGENGAYGSTDEMLKALIEQHMALAGTFLEEKNVPEAHWHAAQADALAARYHLAAQGLPELRQQLAEAEESGAAISKASATMEAKEVSRERLTELAAFYVASENAAIAQGDVSAAASHRRAAEDLVAQYGLSEQAVKDASTQLGPTSVTQRAYRRRVFGTF